MGEEKGEGNKGEFLSRKLFGDAFLKNADDALAKADRDLILGKEEQLNEHLRVAARNLANAMVNKTSPRLTDEENEEWLRLQSKRFRISERGYISINSLDEGSEARLDRLERKAYGQDE